MHNGSEPGEVTVFSITLVSSIRTMSLFPQINEQDLCSEILHKALNGFVKQGMLSFAGRRDLYRTNASESISLPLKVVQAYLGGPQLPC